MTTDNKINTENNLSSEPNTNAVDAQTTDQIEVDTEQLANELEQAKQQNLTLADEILRIKAEMQNIRRRSEEEIIKAKKFGIENFAESLLPVIDSLEAAIANEKATLEQIKQGSELTLTQLKQVFERNKINAITPEVGELFNPNFHQAISTVESVQETNTIVSLLQKGYSIAERIMRPALVIVAAEKKTD